MFYALNNFVLNIPHYTLSSSDFILMNNTGFVKSGNIPLSDNFLVSSFFKTMYWNSSNSGLVLTWLFHKETGSNYYLFFKNLKSFLLFYLQLWGPRGTSHDSKPFTLSSWLKKIYIHRKCCNWLFNWFDDDDSDCHILTDDYDGYILTDDSCLYHFNYNSNILISRSAGAVENTDCTSADG